MERDPRHSRHDDAMTAPGNVIRVEHLWDRDRRVLPDEVEIVYLLRQDRFAHLCDPSIVEEQYEPSTLRGNSLAFSRERKGSFLLHKVLTALFQLFG